MSVATARTKLLEELGNDRDAELSGYDLATRTRTGTATLYVALWQLDTEKLISSRWDNSVSMPGRPRRRLYRITDVGRRRRAAENTKPGRASLLDRLLGLIEGTAAKA